MTVRKGIPRLGKHRKGFTVHTYPCPGPGSPVCPAGWCPPFSSRRAWTWIFPSLTGSSAVLTLSYRLPGAATARAAGRRGKHRLPVPAGRVFHAPDAQAERQRAGLHRPASGHTGHAPGHSALLQRAFRTARPRRVDKHGILDAFLRGIRGCQLPFAQVAEEFRLIENAARTVYLPSARAQPSVSSCAAVMLPGRCCGSWALQRLLL